MPDSVSISVVHRTEPTTGPLILAQSATPNDTCNDPANSISAENEIPSENTDCKLPNAAADGEEDRAMALETADGQGDCEMAFEPEDTGSHSVFDGDELIEGEVASPRVPDAILTDSEMSDYSNESSFDQSNLHLLIPEVELKAAFTDSSSNDQYDPEEGSRTTNAKAPTRSKISSEGDDSSNSAFKVKLYCPLCRRCFYNKKSLNSHVVKKHNTTLGPKFSCHMCGASGSSRSSLKRHLRRTHKVTIFRQPELFTRKCTHCGEGFPSHTELYEHIRANHQDKLERYFHCTSCPAVIRAKASFIRHLRRSHPGQEKAYLTIENCALCGETFSSKQACQRHVKQNHPEMSYHCDKCEATFKYNYLLTRHKLTHLADTDLNKLKRIKKRYKVRCDECGRTYDSKKRLENHVLSAHTEQPKVQVPKLYPCRICTVVSLSAKQNRKHYRRIHLKERLKVHCSQCNITFKTAEECAQHRVLHPTTCDICKKQFLRRDSLREHLMIHADPRHQCPHCPKKFTQSSNLKRHIRVHTGEKPYQCHYCNRRFSDKSACNSHIRVHTGAERSVCEVCGASFSKKQRLNYHMKMHTGKGLIQCPICSRAHTNSYPLRKHVQSHCQPLTNALISLGLKHLVQENPHLVIDSLNLLTEQALEQSVREAAANGEVEPKEKLFVSEEGRGIKQESEDPIEPLEASSDVLESDIPTDPLKPDGQQLDPLEPEDLSKSAERKSLQSGAIKLETFEFNERSLVDRYRSPAALCQLLKDVFKVQQVYAVPKEPVVQPELPDTFADELVKQCLEVIMKAEPNDDDISDEGAEETNDPLDLSSTTTCEQIPKIKISRKLNSQDKDGPVFVAEFIK